METEWQKQQYLLRKKAEFIDYIAGIEWADGGWRGNGDDASPSAFRNASSGVTSAHPDDPLVKWAEGLWEEVLKVVDFEFISKRGPTNALARFLGIPNDGVLQYTMIAIRGREFPTDLEQMEVYKRLSPPLPFTFEQRKQTVIRWRMSTGYKGTLATHQSEYWFSEEVLVTELNRLAKVFPNF